MHAVKNDTQVYYSSCNQTNSIVRKGTKKAQIKSMETKHGRIPENVRRLHIIADNCGYPQVRKSKILIFTNIRKYSETYVKNLKIRKKVNKCLVKCLFTYRSQ